MGHGIIRLDFSSCSVVVVCEQCPHWRGFGFTREEGWRVAIRHEESAHPGVYHQRKAADERKRKSATRRRS